ncbi:MAG: malonyl CoA-ACP transacylase [Mycobacterium sp.]|nr:malonyl CoA-ACP transacylase [Mycobacterium sp.]
MSTVAAHVAGQPITVAELDTRETRLRAEVPAAALPAVHTGEGRQLRRWLTQLLVTERLVWVEAARLGVRAADAPDIDDILPTGPARHEVGSITAAVLAEPLARALFAAVTADTRVGDDEVADYHRRNPSRFADTAPGPDGWRVRGAPPALEQVRPAVTAHLLAAARRRAFRNWLDARRAELVTLAPGFEHPGDPRQPDNVHRH